MANHILKNDHTVLQGLFKRIEEIKHLNHLFAHHADPELANHCQVVKFEKNCLFVLAENGSWATQLRFYIPHLMTQLRAHHPLENLSGIICKTQPSLTKRIVPSKRQRTIKMLSAETAEKIKESAKTIQDLRLRAILEKIANHLSLER